MKNDFKYLTAFSAAFVATLFLAGTIVNFSGGRQQMALTTGAVALFFGILTVVFFQRAKRIGKAKQQEDRIAQEEEQAISQVKLPAKRYSINAMWQDDAKIAELIHLAIDQAIERDFVATEILLKQAENKMASWKPYDTSDAHYEMMWCSDIKQIRAYIQEKEGV